MATVSEVHISSGSKLVWNLCLRLRDETVRVRPECLPEVFMSEVQFMLGTGRGIKSQPSLPASVSTARKGQALEASLSPRSCPPRPSLLLCPLHYPCGFSGY